MRKHGGIWFWTLGPVGGTLYRRRPLAKAIRNYDYPEADRLRDRALRLLVWACAFTNISVAIALAGSAH